MPKPLTSTLLGPLCGLALAVNILMGSSTAHAQAASPGPPPPQVQQLLHLLEDPAVRRWVDQEHQPAIPVNTAPQSTASEMMAARTAGLREHLAAVGAAAPRLPGEFRNAVNQLRD